MKKTIAFILAAALAAGTVLSGCSGKDSQSAGTDGKQKITYWAAINVNAVSVIQNYDELLMYQELEKKFNVDLEFKHPPAGQEVEQFNLLISSRDLPDMVEYGWLNYKGGPGKAISDNIIISINDYMDSSAPNLKKLIEQKPDLEKQLTTDKGDYYVMPALSYDTYTNFGGLFLRKDWLEDLNMAVPETIDEWETVLTAFKDQKGATAPLSYIKEYLSMAENNTWHNAFGTGRSFYLDNGKVKYAPAEQGYKEYIQTMKRWLDNGLLDQDIISNDWKNVDSKVLSGKTGAVTGALGAKFGKYMTLAREGGDERFAMVAAPVPVKNKGDVPKFKSVMQEYDGSGSVAITTKNKNPELSVRIMDYFYSDEGAMLKNFGVEGVTYTLQDGEPVYTDLITKNPDGLAIAQAMAKYTRCNVNAPGLNNDKRYLDQYYTFPEMKEAIKVYNEYAEECRETNYPAAASFTTEEASEVSTIQQEIDTYRNEIFVKFLLGTEPLDNFDQYVEKLNQIGLPRILEIKQAAYERYIQK